MKIITFKPRCSDARAMKYAPVRGMRAIDVMSKGFVLDVDFEGESCWLVKLFFTSCSNLEEGMRKLIRWRMAPPLFFIIHTMKKCKNVLNCINKILEIYL